MLLSAGDASACTTCSFTPRNEANVCLCNTCACTGGREAINWISNINDFPSFEGVLLSVALCGVSEGKFSKPNKPWEAKWKSFSPHPKTSISCPASWRRGKPPPPPAHRSQTGVATTQQKSFCFHSVVLTRAVTHPRWNSCSAVVIACRQMMKNTKLSLSSPSSSCSQQAQAVDRDILPWRDHREHGHDPAGPTAGRSR